MDNNGLELSMSKTEAVLMISKKGQRGPDLELKVVRLQMKDPMRYLGVELHKGLCFKARHLIRRGPWPD